MTHNELKAVIRNNELMHNYPRVVADGILVVLQHEDRLYVFNRQTQQSFELLPNFESGLTIEQL